MILSLSLSPSLSLSHSHTHTGVDVQELLAHPTFSPALGRAVERLLARADYLYARSDAGISMLPRPCRQKF